MTSIDALTSEWDAMATDQQHRQWVRFLDELDAGAGGHHRYYPILMPRWDRGDVPEAVNDLALRRYEDEQRADLHWALAAGVGSELLDLEPPY